MSLTLAEVAQFLRLAHGLCYASFQGRTVDDHILLLDLAHQHFHLRTLNVGMSRATHGKYVHLATWSQEQFLLKRAPPLQLPQAPMPQEPEGEDSDPENDEGRFEADGRAEADW